MGAIKNRTNTRYGRLTAKYQVKRNKHNQIQWFCECSCGNTCVVVGYNLTTGHTTSCGCLQKEILSINRKTHGKSLLVEYKIWIDMKKRCYNKKATAYKDYGGRGIIVCLMWKNSFENFLADMGERPSNKHSIDRKDNDGNYEPGNCKWSTKTEQANNTRKNKPFYAISPIGRFYRHNSRTVFSVQHPPLTHQGISAVLSTQDRQKTSANWRFFLI